MFHRRKSVGAALVVAATAAHCFLSPPYFIGVYLKKKGILFSPRRKSVGAALVVAATASSLVLSYSPAEADFSPQPKDVVATGSDALQFAYNFLADGYH